MPCLSPKRDLRLLHSDLIPLWVSSQNRDSLALDLMEPDLSRYPSNAAPQA